MFFVTVTAQPSDFVILKKNNKSLQTFYTGKTISFKYNDYRQIFGIIQNIKNDSIFIEQWNIRSIGTPLGLVIADTIKNKPEGFAIKNIVKIPNPKARSQFALPGAVLMIGSGGYAALHVINNLTQKGGKVEAKNLLSAAGFFGLGALLTWLKPKDIVTLGNKYQLHYIDISTINVPQ